ncbi:MAG TPA: SO2930 family diheme c-type cytochrome [Candidatus Kryptonia bacterium]|nr:SO2930 family diheme c-type cytochrome [Candidatus Kryptonia bacterium]
MASTRSRLTWLSMIPLVALAGAVASCGGTVSTPSAATDNACSSGRCIELSASAQDEATLQLALIDARPGDVIMLRAGTYHLLTPLSLDVDNVTLRGEGMDKTILSFRGQTLGAQGLLVTADNFVIEDLAIEDSAGDLLKIEGADGVTVRRVRTEYTNGPATTNGSYGIYPVECHDVLIENSIARGASDTGIYVGQSHNIIVRNNLVEENVSGIEIENSTDADVYGNLATHNTGGILVFNLPGVPFTDGRRTRVFQNRIIANNTPNFAAVGTTVSAVPVGTGVMILANDQVQVFDNDFEDNGTTGVLLISYYTAQIIGGFNTDDPTYDFFSEGLYIFGNTFSGGGTMPDKTAGDLVKGILGNVPVPNILYDGFSDPNKLVNGVLPAALRTCIQQPGTSFLDFDLPQAGSHASTDVTPYDCTLDRLPAIEIPGAGSIAPTPAPFPTAAAATPTPGPSSGETRCKVSSGTGVNFDPSDAPCDLLSSYRLFKGDGSTQEPNDGVTPYDLNTQLFADYAVKHRFVWLPAHTSAVYNDNAAFDFPVGTVIVKTFAYPLDLRAPEAGDTLIETRLLVHRASGWEGLPYLWNDDKTEARLAVVGATVPVDAIQEDGVMRTYNYHVPNGNECKECHEATVKTMSPLGPKARNLNKLYAYADGTENQLSHWSRLGLLTGAPDPGTAPFTPPFDDPSAGTLEQRARGYLDVNCAHCHNAGGAARTTGFYLTIDETNRTQLGICKSPVAAGRATGGLHFDIAPGDPDSSIVIYRMNSTEPGVAMPELGRQRVHSEAVDVIRQWIASLNGSCS